MTPWKWKKRIVGGLILQTIKIAYISLVWECPNVNQQNSDAWKI